MYNLKWYGKYHCSVFPLQFPFLSNTQWLTSQSGLHSESLWHYQLTVTSIGSKEYQGILNGDLLNLRKNKQSTYWDTGSFQNWWCWQSLWFRLVPVSSIIYSFCGRLQDKKSKCFYANFFVGTIYFKNGYTKKRDKVKSKMSFILSFLSS